MSNLSTLNETSESNHFLVTTPLLLVRVTKNLKMTSLKILELYSGIGGMHYASECKLF